MIKKHIFAELDILNNLRIFFSKQHKVMFLHSPKCGSSYLKSFSLLNLSNQKISEDINHYELISNEELGINTWRKNNSITLENLNDPTIQKFQITRNPYERVSSYFKHKILRFIIINLQKHSLSNPLSGEDKTFRSLAMNQKSNFNMFITTLENPNEPKVHKNIPLDTFIEIHEHLYPQYHWLFSKYFTPIDLKDLENKLQDIFPNTILPSKKYFTHHNHNVWGDNWTEKIKCYTQETKDKIYNLYKDDFTKFNYEK